MQPSVSRQSSVDNSHTLYKVNLISCELIPSLKYLINTNLETLPSSWSYLVSVFQGEVLSSLCLFFKKQSPQSVPNSPFLTITATILKSDMIPKVMYAVWLPHCHRGQLIRSITSHTHLSRGFL